MDNEEKEENSLKFGENNNSEKRGEEDNENYYKEVEID